MNASLNSVPSLFSQSDYQHETISNCDDDDEGHDAAGYTSREEMADAEVTLTCLGVF